MLRKEIKNFREAVHPSQFAVEWAWGYDANAPSNIWECF
jgi:hypothetical protein